VIKKQPVRRTPLATEQESYASSQQFKATPRFRPTGTPGVPLSTPSTAQFLTPGRQIGKQEDIIDLQPGSNQDVHDSIERVDQEIDLEYLFTDTNHDFMVEGPNPKRRRFSSSPVLGSDDQSREEGEDLGDAQGTPPPAVVASPPASRRPVSSTAPRFLTSTQSATQANESTFLKPPRFRPPEPQEQEPSTDPLPDQFSPHRRGQKYVPGGLAAEVRDWLVNIESSIPSSSTTKSGSPWLFRLMVDEISGGGRAGITLVKGRQILTGDTDTMIDSLGIISVILAGEGTSTGLQKNSKVEVGKTVGVRSPVWEVMIDGVKWGVGVDWNVLDGLDINT
jgi:hypothetical protein